MQNTKKEAKIGQEKQKIFSYNSIKVSEVLINNTMWQKKELNTPG